MLYQRTITDIPQDKIDMVVGDFESEGAIVSKTKQDDGSWTIVATFP